MAARFKEPDAAHDHIADSEFAIQEFNERHATGDDIAPRFVAERLCVQLGRSHLDSFLFNEAYRLVRPVGRFPRFPKKAVAFQAAVRKGADFGESDHWLGRLWSDVKRDNLTLPARACELDTAPQFGRGFPRESLFTLGHESLNRKGDKDRRRQGDCVSSSRLFSPSVPVSLCPALLVCL